MPKEAKQPKELVNLDQQEEMTTKGVAVVLQSLKRACEDGRKINFFRFLVDPRSFSQTVENIFHFTFLIKARILMWIHVAVACMHATHTQLHSACNSI